MYGMYNTSSLKEMKTNTADRPAYFNTFPKRQILDCPKLKEFADDDFKFDENDRKFLNW